jgi:phenylpropionate dioxygenase-like ring-hydroxylating dioxygenase large terminal subunit
MTASAWLGGMLVYKHRVGVDHRERFSGPHDWTPVLPLLDVPDRGTKRVEVERKGVLLYREADQVYAIGSVCSHAGGSWSVGA